MSSATKTWPTNWLTVTDDEVVVLGEAARDILYSYSGEIYADEISDEQISEFLALFDIIPDNHIQGDPKEDFYQGMTFMKVIKRKSDGKLYGYPIWKPVAKYDEASLEANGDQYGYEFPLPEDTRNFDWDHSYVSAYVWRPVEPFTITGYTVISD